MGPDRDLAILISLARVAQSESLKKQFQFSEIEKQLTKDDSKKVAAALLSPERLTLNEGETTLLFAVKKLAGVN